MDIKPVGNLFTGPQLTVHGLVVGAWSVRPNRQSIFLMHNWKKRHKITSKQHTFFQHWYKFKFRIYTCFFLIFQRILYNKLFIFILMVRNFILWRTNSFIKQRCTACFESKTAFIKIYFNANHSRYNHL